MDVFGATKRTGGGSCASEAFEKFDNITNLTVAQRHRRYVERATLAFLFTGVSHGNEIYIRKPISLRKLRLRWCPHVAHSNRVQMMPDNALKCRVGSVVAVWGRESNVAKHGGAEAIGVFQYIAFPHPPHVARLQVKSPGFARSKGGQGESVKFLIRQKGP